MNRARRWQRPPRRALEMIRPLSGCCADGMERISVGRLPSTHRSRSSGPSTSAACASARDSAGSSDGSVVLSAMSWMFSKWCSRCASASCRVGPDTGGSTDGAGMHPRLRACRNQGQKAGAEGWKVRPGRTQHVSTIFMLWFCHAPPGQRQHDPAGQSARLAPASCHPRRLPSPSQTLAAPHPLRPLLPRRCRCLHTTTCRLRRLRLLLLPRLLPAPKCAAGFYREAGRRRCTESVGGPSSTQRGKPVASHYLFQRANIATEACQGRCWAPVLCRRQMVPGARTGAVKEYIE